MSGLLSIIIPSYNEEQMIGKAFVTISRILNSENIEFEICFVDDGSQDHTWDEIRKISNNDLHAKGIHLSRNFGKESAILAGIEATAGECCVVMDCDLQHPAEKIVEMYRLWEQGYEIVEAVKSSRGEETKLRALSAKCFYTIISKFSGIDMDRASDFKLLDRKAMLVILNMKERNSFFRALSSWIGFKTTQVEFEVQKREAGETKWSTWKLIKYAISNITSFSAAPMQIVTVLGVVTLLLSLIFGSISMVQKIMGIAGDGFTTVILLQLLTSSIIMISLGIIGVYIAKMYDEIKSRPKYIVSEKCGYPVQEDVHK